MGVLACDCYGYLCWECKTELENTQMTDFASFMQSAKCTYPDKSIWQDEVNSEFKSRYD